MNEYDEILSGDADRAKLRQSMYGAVGVNPDQYAEAKRVGQVIGVPADIAARNPDEVKRKVLLNEYDQLLATSPRLAKKYGAEPEFAKLAHDDAGMLASIEQSFQRAEAAGRAVRGQVDEAFVRPNGLRSSGGGVGETFIRRGNMTGQERPATGAITEPVRRGVAQGDRGLTLLDIFPGLQRRRDEARAAAGLDPSGNLGLATRLATQQREVERFPIPGDIRAGMEEISGAETMGDAASAIVRNPRAVFETTLQSLGVSGPALAAAVAGSTMGPMGTAAGAGAGSFVIEYANTLQDVMAEKGVDGKDALAVSVALGDAELMAAAREKALKRGVPIALFDALTAGVAGKLLAGARGTAGSIAPRVAGELGVQAAGGAAGEATAQAVTGEYKPGDILLEAIAELPTAIVEVPSNYGHAMQRAEAKAAQVEQIAKLAEASKLKERDPQAFREFIAQAAETGEGPADLYIDAQQLTNSLNQSAITLQELRAIAPTVADQLQAAIPGADIRVPVAEFAAAPSDVTAGLIDHLRESPQAMSRAEAREFLKQQGAQIQQEVMRTLEARDRETAFQQGVEKVREHIEQQLQAVGKFRPEVNRTYATVLGNFYATQAERSGMTVDEFMDRYQLRVTAKDGAGAQRLEQGGTLKDVLTQWDATGIKHAILEKDGVITVSQIIVPEAERGAGKGTAAMQALVDYADATGQHVALSPSADFGGDKKRLVKFYKRFGFVENKGKNRAFSTSESMYRLAPGKVLEQPAFHGSPYDFDRFSTDAIGTGEGAQAYGWGLYFAENVSVAKQYGDNVKDMTAVQRINAEMSELAKVMAADEVPGSYRQYRTHAGKQAATRYDELMAERSKVRTAPGKMYQVEIPDDVVARMLLWDKPVPEDIVRRVAEESVRRGLVEDVDTAVDAIEGESDRRGELLYRGLSEQLGSDQHASQFLDAIGIPGVRYLDAGSRNRPLKQIKREFLAELPEDAGFDEVLDLVGTGKFSPANEAILKALTADDWLGFDYPAQALSAALGKDLTQFDASDALKQAVAEAQVDATYNLVVFNDKNVKLTHKDGSPVTAAERAEFFQGGRDAPRGTLSFGNDITSVPSIIGLMEGADLSTFLHESGHLFLEVQTDLAQRIVRRGFGGQEETSANEQQIVADMEAILTWMEIAPADTGSRLDAWALMTLEEKREHHEKFARGFERYLMEGKAPSQELQPLFAKFRAWLVSVYRALSGLNVDLSDDVRAVMDRMLATNEAILEAENARNMGPLFRSPEQAGMTPEEYAAYQALGDQQTTTAAAELDARLMRDMKWLSKARDKALKARQEEVADLRREVRSEITAQVMAAPIYQAWQVLTGKGEVLMPGTGAPITPESNIKLRTKLVKEISPDAWSRLSERRMTSEDRGWDPDLVAEALGFSSGDQLVNQLARVQPPGQVIEEMVDQQMLERYGDITSQQALERAADEAVHNEVRARVVATELKALEKASTVRTGKRSTVDAMARAAKEYAYAVIAGQRVRDLRPSQYAAAQARSAKLAMQVLGKSIEEAAMHKRNEMINGYAAKAAYDAQEEVRALQKYFRKFAKRLDSIDPGYQDQIEQLLERFDFKPASLKTIDRRKSFRAWYDEQVEAGNAPDVPVELLEDSARKSYKDMTVEELRGLADTVKQIEHQGRLKNKLLLARDARDFDAIVTEVEASLIEHGGDKRPVELEGPNPVTDWFAGVWAAHRKLASLFRQMDGNQDNGPMWKFIGQAMNERSTMEDVMLEQATVKLRELYEPLTKLRGGITGYRSKVFIPQIDDSLTRGGRLAVALNWGNEANRQRLADGNKWSVDQVQAVLKTLTPAELEFVNKTWEFLDSYWPEIAAKEKRLTGVEPPKVEAAPFNVLLPDGTEVAMRGGYYPLKYDTNASDRADQQEAAQVAKEMMQGAFTRATTRRGHTKERLKEVKRKVRLDLNVVTQHVTQVAHDLAWHEWLIDTNKLLGDERIAGAIREHYGPKVLKTIRDDVLGIATADVVPQTDIDRALLMLRGNVTRATMGASVTTAFLQPFGLTQSMVRIGGRHVLRGMARWGGDAARMESAVAWIHERSEFMRLRAKTFNRELREIRGTVAGKSKTMRVVDASLFFFMQKMQMVADVPTWLGQYEKSLAEGSPEADAIAMADRAVLESQGGGATKDLAEVQRRHPMLTQFYSYFSVTLNLAAEQTAATDFKNPAAVAGWLGDMALLMVIPAILPSFILYSLRGGDDDDEKGMLRRVLEWQVSYLLGTVVGARELSGAVAGFDYAGPPVARIVTDLYRAGAQTIQGEVDEPLVKAYINLLGAAFGIPTVQALRSYRGWKAWDEGEDGAGAQSVLLGPPAKD